MAGRSISRLQIPAGQQFFDKLAEFLVALPDEIRARSWGCRPSLGHNRDCPVCPVLPVGLAWPVVPRPCGCGAYPQTCLVSPSS